jgi:hypothetical protein
VPVRLSAIALLVLSAVASCGHGIAVQAVVRVPPQLPVRVFPEIVVVAGIEREDVEVADALADHLRATGAARVERLDEERLEARRVAGDLGPAAAVVRVQTRVLETTRPTFVSRPETVCTTWGCSTMRRSVVDDVPVTLGRVVLRVSEGRSGRPLQVLAIDEREEGNDPLAMRLRVVTALRRRAIAAVDTGEQQVAIELAEVDDPEVRAALAAIPRGHPSEARAALERIVARSDFASRAVEVRARIIFDLGQARRLEARQDGGSDLDVAERLAESERAIRDAMRLHPEPPYGRALAQIEEERRARARMRAHEAAASHNFALDEGTAVPEPPPGYREASP